MEMANKISKIKIARSKGFPSSNSMAAEAFSWKPNHLDGRRDPAMNIQMIGTHKAKELFARLAGSKYRSARSKIAHRISASVGGMV
jgi:hypothetical protein